MPTVISFPAPGKTITLNGREHWALKARLNKMWRQAAWAAGIETGRTPGARALPPSVVTVEIPVRGDRRRDPHNWMATVKPIIDGLVDAGLWPDDDQAHVAVSEPVLVVGSPHVVVRIHARSET